MTAEQWKPVVGYDGYYEVSNGGRVRSLTRRGQSGRVFVGRVLRPVVDRKGYLRISLAREGGSRPAFIHILAMAAFVGPKPDGSQVRHLDGDCKNNYLDNLGYGTPSENAQDILRHGHNYFANKTRCDRGHEFSPENTRIEVSSGRTYRRCQTCRRTNLAAFRHRKRLAKLTPRRTL